MSYLTNDDGTVKFETCLIMNINSIVETWLIKNIDSTVVPNDEGNGDALLYNLVHLLYNDDQKYNYEPEQDKEIEFWLRLRKEWEKEERK